MWNVNICNGTDNDKEQKTDVQVLHSHSIAESVISTGSWPNADQWECGKPNGDKGEGGSA